MVTPDMTTQNSTILLVDDDDLVRATYDFALKAAGYIVLLASDGSKGLELLRQHTVEVAILDVFMPGQDGIETLLAIKREFPHVRIYLMSGGGTRGKYDFLAAGLKLGADGILRKPISPQRLISVLRGEDGRADPQ